MEELSRPPTRAEQVIGAIFSLIAALLFGTVAVFILSRDSISVPAAVIFSVLFLASVTMFCRAAFTARRSLSKGESSGLVWTLLIGGIIGAVVALFWGSGTNRLMLLGASLSGIGYGLAGLSRRSR